MASPTPTPPANFSPVTQVLDPSAVTASEERVSEEQFNTLHASSVTYRDLLIFEERLKLNMVRLKKRQQKYEGMYSEKLRYSSKFVPQCNRVLRIFNMHFNRDNRPELAFFRKVPKKFQEGFTAYKASYFKRKSEKRAAAAAAKAAGGSVSGAGVGATGMTRSVSGQSRRLQPSTRGRRAPGSGGGSASGSDSGVRPTMGLGGGSGRLGSLTRATGGGGEGVVRRPGLATNSSISSNDTQLAFGMEYDGEKG
ncbi:hypothetical protein EC991_009447 [Linnemannia zychae]|nr:hypothetical protein EC991_009447 [Linnemannia zychae]